MVNGIETIPEPIRVRDFSSITAFHTDHCKFLLETWIDVAVLPSLVIHSQINDEINKTPSCAASRRTVWYIFVNVLDNTTVSLFNAKD
jgi:hypothetical protein